MRLFFYPAHIRGPLLSLPASVASIPTAVVLGSGTLCGFHTYVGADDMWVSCRGRAILAAYSVAEH